MMDKRTRQFWFGWLCVSVWLRTICLEKYFSSLFFSSHTEVRWLASNFVVLCVCAVFICTLHVNSIVSGKEALLNFIYFWRLNRQRWLIQTYFTSNSTYFKSEGFLGKLSLAFTSIFWRHSTRLICAANVQKIQKDIFASRLMLMGHTILLFVLLSFVVIFCSFAKQVWAKNHDALAQEVEFFFLLKITQLIQNKCMIKIIVWWLLLKPFDGHERSEKKTEKKRET